MANEYASAVDLKTYMAMDQTITVDDARIVFACEDASRTIDAFCRRRFYADANATARVYEPAGGYTLRVDDFYTTSGLLVKADYDGDGTFETVFAASAYELAPMSGGSEGIEGYPFTEVRLISTSWPWPAAPLRRGRAEITAKWGWATVPNPVFRATLMVAAEMFRRKDAPLGFQTTGGDFGGMRVGNDVTRQVQSLLAPFRRVGAMASGAGRV